MGNSQPVEKPIIMNVDGKKIPLGPKAKLCYTYLPDKQDTLINCLKIEKGFTNNAECINLYKEAKEAEAKEKEKIKFERLRSRLDDVDKPIFDTIIRNKSKTDFLFDCMTLVGNNQWIHNKNKWDTYNCIKYRKNILQDADKKLVNDFFGSAKKEQKDDKSIGERVALFLNCKNKNKNNCGVFLSFPPPLPSRQPRQQLSARLSTPINSGFKKYKQSNKVKKFRKPVRKSNQKIRKSKRKVRKSKRKSNRKSRKSR